MAEQSRRFVSLDKPIDKFIEDKKNKNTLSKTRRDVSLLTEFLNCKNESGRIEEIPPKELNEYISEFIVAVRRKDGEDFEPSSLRGLICSFNRHLKACKYPCSVIEDSQFEQARQALEARSKELKKDGKGNNSMYKINKLQHGKRFVRDFHTRWFCIRNLTRSLRSLVRFQILHQIV